MSDDILRAFAMGITNGCRYTQSARTIQLTQMFQECFLGITFADEQQCPTNLMDFSDHGHPLKFWDGAIGTRHVFRVEIVICSYSFNTVQPPGIALAMRIFLHKHDLRLMEQTQDFN